MKVLIFIAIFALSQAQFPLDTVKQKPWKGPFADHHIGIHPGDTPEVSAAKIQHLGAYQDVLAGLPELSSEDRYIMEELPSPVVRVIQEQARKKLNYVENISPVSQIKTPHIQSVMPVVPKIQNQQHVVEVQGNSVVPTMFAENIPKSSIEEVPEVYVARLAHLKAALKTRTALTV